MMLSQFADAAGAPTVAINARRRGWLHRDLADHLEPVGPKRVLSIDGGGVRGGLAIAVLERIEVLLRRRHGNHASFRLADYFDLIGGTSTGAVIAAALAAKGYAASDVRDLYADIVPRVFRGDGAFGLGNRLHPRFSGRHLLAALGDEFQDLTLGDARLHTGLAVVAKRVDVDQTWIMHNNPAGKYFNDPKDRSFVGNKHYLLANVLRASTAAPYHFAPDLIEIVRLPRKVQGLFIDGGVTPHNNPAFQFFLLTTLPTQGFRWATGQDKLHITSVGTGSLCNDVSTEQVRLMPTSQQAKHALTSVIDGAEHMAELVMQLLSEPSDPQELGAELGDLRDVRITPEPLFSYQRYQAELRGRFLREALGVALSARQLDRVRDMSHPDGFQIAYEIGQAIADRLVTEAHFPASFDLPPPPSLSGETAEPLVASHATFATSAPMPRPTRPLAPSARALARR